MIPAFVASLVLVALEVAHVRLLSYAIDPRLVYAGIGIALAGMSGASIAVATRPSLAKLDPARLLPLLAVSLVASNALLAHLAPFFAARSMLEVFVRALPILLVCAVPYVIGGPVLTIAVSTAGANVTCTWAAGLAGSALGSVLLPPFMTSIGLDREIALLAVVAAASGFAVTRRSGAIVTAIACAAVVPLASRVMPFRPDPRDLLGLAERAFARVDPQNAARGITRDYSAWDPMARVEVWAFPGSFGTLNDGVPIKLVTQDGGAGTILIGFGAHEDARVAWTERSVYATGYVAQPSPSRVLVIGLGGGVDVVTALQHGAHDVTGVEINGSILNASQNVFRDFQSGVLARPEVKLVHADGRSFLEQAERRGERWPFIQMSGADTYSAGGGGAFMFSESYLYTVDAFRRYFRALTDDGTLALIRFGPEPLRAVISEAVAMKQLGLGDLEHRFVVLRQGICFGILASKRVLGADDRKRLAQLVESSIKSSRVKLPMWDAMGFGIDEPLHVEYAPDLTPQSPYRAALLGVEQGRLSPILEALPLDYSPTTDDRPFFFQFEKPRDWPRLLTSDTREFFAEGLLGYARLVAGFLLVAAVLFFAPLARAKERPTAREAIYFASLGLAFALVELVVIQRTVLVLGLPTWSVAITIAALLVGSGLGSTWAGRLSRRGVLGAVGAILVLLVIYDASFAAIVDRLLRVALWTRAVAMVAMLVPLGVAMGIAFPVGLRAAEARGGPPAVAWALAINGILAVLASLVATPAAMVTGFRALLFVAAGLYVLVALTAAREPSSAARP